MLLAFGCGSAAGLRMLVLRDIADDLGLCLVRVMCRVIRATHPARLAPRLRLRGGGGPARGPQAPTGPARNPAAPGFVRARLQHGWLWL